MRDQTLRRLVATAWVVCLGVLAWDVGAAPAEAEPPPPAAADPPPLWPDWHPQPQALQPLEAMGSPTSRGPEEGPALSARSVFVFDLDAEEVLLSRSADERRPVASLTKVVAALAMATERPDLDQERCVDAAFYPTRSGAFSKLSTGECYRAEALVASALVASDNRGAYGMQVASGLAYDRFIRRMDQVSAELGMGRSTWADPSGLEDDNLSTARDMAKAVLALAAHPDLAPYASAPRWHLARTNTPHTRWLRSTNRLLRRDDLHVEVGKTGYTDTARYCFAGVIRTAQGRRLALSVLGASTSSRRWRDLRRLLRWADEVPPR